MKKFLLVLLSLTSLFLVVGCTTVAQTQFYRPAMYAGEPYRVSGKLNPMAGWAGEVFITINEQTVISKKLPMFASTTEVFGTYEGKPVSVTLTRCTTFMSSYVRADVFIGAERAAVLTF